MEDEYSSWKGWDAASFGACGKRAARYYGWHVQRLFGERGGLAVLEVGFGNGAFMGWLREHGHRVVGVESNPVLVARARERGFEAVEELGTVAEGAAFDLIAAFDVAEHVPAAELPGFLRALRARCAANGRLLLRFPNGDSPFGLIHQNGDLTHVSAIGRHKLQQAASMSGWRIAGIGDAPWWADQTHPRSLRTALRGGLRHAFEGFVGFLYYNERVDLEPNMVARLEPV